jgi:hypothetical protein
LPFPDGAFGRAFVGNVLGVLPPPERAALVREARRVASELVVFETSDALTGEAEQWQERALSDASRYRIYRRYFAAGDIVEEIGGGRVLFDGDHFVLVASREADHDRDELSARLLDRLGAPALVELTAFIVLANLYTRTNTAFGIESQGFSAACDLKPLAVPSTA